MNNNSEILSLVYVNQGMFECNEPTNCPYKERTISYAIGVRVPTPAENPDELFKECCYKHFIFADSNSSEDFKNDYSSFYHQRQLSNESCNFFLVKISNNEEFALNNDTYGSYFGYGYFATNLNLKGYLVRWKKVLEELGEGAYRIVKRINIAGVSVEYPSITFNLQQFSTQRANGTWRMDIVMNGKFENSNVDFIGTSWKHSIRVPGFFGNRNPGYVKDNLVKRSFEKKQISMKQTNEYRLQTKLIPSCITNEVFDFMLFADNIFMNDYNLNNHSYDFKKFPVDFESNEDVGYLPHSRKARINLTFSDKYDNNLKRNYR